jgi:hypothetical protein
MVTPIDAVRCGMGFDARGHWHQARARFVPAPRNIGDEDSLAPARGVLLGLIASSLLWAGIIVAARALLHLF